MHEDSYETNVTARVRYFHRFAAFNGLGGQSGLAGPSISYARQTIEGMTSMTLRLECRWKRWHIRLTFARR